MKFDFPPGAVSIQGHYTETTDRRAHFFNKGTIYQDRNLDLPWSSNDAKALGKAAWPEIDYSKSIVIFGVEYGALPAKFIQRWDLDGAER